MAVLSLLAITGLVGACTSHRSASAPASSAPAVVASSTTTSTASTVSANSTVAVASSPPLTKEEAAALVASKSGMYGNWVPVTDEYDPAATLSAVMGLTPGATGSSPEQLFFFHLGRYLGTATSDARFAFSISARTDDTVTVTYLHYQPGDPTCCPSREPYVVRYHWDGTRVVPLDPIPPPDQGWAG